MTRRTAVPGVFVEQLEVETPPYDEPGVVQEYVGESLYQEYETLQMPSRFGGQQVMNFIKEARDKIGFIGDEYQLIYHLKVSALMKRTARSKARAFARIKNPFEPKKMNVKRIQRSTSSFDKTLVDAPQKVYDVQVAVTK